MERARRSQQIIDIVIPACNEEAVIGLVIEALFERLRELPYRFELIVVDDGSTDRTAAIAMAHARNRRLRIVRLTRNFGKEAALLAGLDHARGAATILMDADLQHPVELIPTFLAHWEQGYECVYAVKEHRRSESLLKRAATWLLYSGINRGAEVAIHAGTQDFGLFDRTAVRALCSIRERVRFTKGLYAWLGFRSIVVPFVQPPRAAGASNFRAARLLRLGWDGLTSFSDLPLRIAAIVGVSLAIAAGIYALSIGVRALVFGADMSAWATLTVAVIFIGGLQILFLGVLGEYVRNVLIETKQRPNYLLRDVVQAGPSHVAPSNENEVPPRVQRTSRPLVSVQSDRAM